MNELLTQVDFEKAGGLVPVVVQNARTLQVLMLGYMDRPALEATLESGEVTFYSRSKERLWKKGESSGNILKLVDARTDCDSDALLVLADPVGPTCHLERISCFDTGEAPGVGFLAALEDVIASRKGADAGTSYTAKLFEAGVKRIAQKVGEEGVETALAAVAEEDEKLLGEAADLMYHLITLMQARGLSLGDVVEALRGRRG